MVAVKCFGQATGNNLKTFSWIFGPHIFVSFTYMPSARKTLKEIKTSKSAEKAYPATIRDYLGRAWNNEAGKNSKMSGQVYQNLTFDNNVKEIAFKIEDKDGAIEQITVPNDGSTKFHLYPNEKREGKKDADSRFVMLTESA